MRTVEEIKEQLEIHLNHVLCEKEVLKEWESRNDSHMISITLHRMQHNDSVAKALEWVLNESV